MPFLLNIHWCKFPLGALEGRIPKEENQCVLIWFQNNGAASEKKGDSRRSYFLSLKSSFSPPKHSFLSSHPKELEQEQWKEEMERGLTNAEWGIESASSLGGTSDDPLRQDICIFSASISAIRQQVHQWVPWQVSEEAPLWCRQGRKEVVRDTW